MFHYTSTWATSVHARTCALVRSATMFWAPPLVSRILITDDVKKVQLRLQLLIKLGSNATAVACAEGSDKSIVHHWVKNIKEQGSVARRIEIATH